MLTPQQETKIVALIARGDSYGKIREQIKKEDGIAISAMGVSNVKKRNSEALSYIQQKMIDHETNKATSILNKARDLIEKKLDKADDESIPDELQRAYDDGEIDTKQFLDRKASVINQRRLSVGELNMVAKEAFNQSQIESGKPTSITNSPEIAKERLQGLLKAINSGDPEAIAKAVFLDA